MAELVASALIVLAAVAFVLEPLARRPTAALVPTPGAETLPDADAANLVAVMRTRLASRCPHCGEDAGQAALYCPRCGKTMLSHGRP